MNKMHYNNVHKGIHIQGASQQMQTINILIIYNSDKKLIIIDDYLGFSNGSGIVLIQYVLQKPSEIKQKKSE